MKEEEYPREKERKRERERDPGREGGVTQATGERTGISTTAAHGSIHSLSLSHSVFPFCTPEYVWYTALKYPKFTFYIVYYLPLLQISFYHL